jgi:hypothetical protein
MRGRCVGMRLSRWKSMKGLLHSIGLLLGQMEGIIMLGMSLFSSSWIYCFMMADGRYGMGVVYAKTGKLRHAEHHYRRAADINPSNAVLLSSIGSVSHFRTFLITLKMRGRD